MWQTDGIRDTTRMKRYTISNTLYAYTVHVDLCIGGYVFFLRIPNPTVLSDFLFVNLFFFFSSAGFFSLIHITFYNENESGNQLAPLDESLCHSGTFIKIKISPVIANETIT